MHYNKCFVAVKYAGRIHSRYLPLLGNQLRMVKRSIRNDLKGTKHSNISIITLQVFQFITATGDIGILCETCQIDYCSVNRICAIARRIYFYPFIQISGKNLAHSRRTKKICKDTKLMLN